MSWMKHRAVPGSGSSGRPPPTSATPPMPPVQMYNPNQHSNPQLTSQWQQVDLSAPSPNTWYDNQQPVQQQNNWYQPQTQQPPTQQHQQLYSNQQQSTSYYQQPNQQVHYQPQQQTLYQPTLPQQQPMQSYINSSSNAVDNKSEAWNDWNTWDDEDNSNNTHNIPEESPNANVKQEVVEDSFATNQSWNWDADEQKRTATLADNNHHANDLFPTVKVKTESLDTSRQEQFTKSVKSETLTPQWSIESQPSQDSSTDDVALLQSDTEQKHLANTTITTTNSSNPASSSDLTSNSLTSTTTNTNSIESKEVAGGFEQTHTHIPQTNNISGNLRDLQHSGQNRLVHVVGSGKSLSGQHAGVGHQQSGLNQQQVVRTPTNSYRSNTTTILDNIEVTSSTLLQSERNQYLETGQLLGDNGDNADSSQAPPPAFSRVVVGQRESNDDVRFGAERTLPAGSAVARTSTYRPRGDTSDDDDDDEDSAFDDNEPLAPSFQPILPRSATIGAETLAPSSFVPLIPTIQTSDTSNNFNQQRDTHLDGANTLDDLNRSSVQQDINQVQASGGELIVAAVGGGSSIGEGGSGPEGQEEADLLIGGMRQLVVSGGESDSQRTNDIIKRSSKHTNDTSEDIPQPLSDDPLPNAPVTASNQKRQQRQSSSNNKTRDDYTPQQERGDNTSSSRRPPTEATNRRTGGRGDYGDSRRGDPGRRYNRRRDRSDDSIDYDREAGGLMSGEEDRDRRGAEEHRRRRKDVVGDDGYGRDGRRHKPDERDRYRHRDDPRSYYRSSTKRRDDYDDFDDDLGGGASRASSRSESLQEVYRGDRNRDRNRDRDGDRRQQRGDRDDRDRREKQSGNRGYGGRRGDRGDPYGSAAYMQGYYDLYGHNSAHAHPYYYQQYQYYENLRVTNPQAYAEWYRKFYQGQQGTMQQQQSSHQRGINTAVSAITEDRVSLHSGRSSTNDDIAKERYLRQSYYGGHNAATILQQQHNASVGYYHSLNRDSASISSHYGLDDSRQDYTDSNTLNASFQPIDTSSTSLSHYGPTTTQHQPRLTPAKFSTSHAIASLTSSVTGQLVHVPVQYPQDGEGAVVQLIALVDVLGDEREYKEMVRFPGPLLRGVTHKKTVIEYCEEKIRTAREDIVIDCDSYILLWELLILLLSHNGVVVGADISDLLMRNNHPQQLCQNIRPSSVNSNTSSNACIDQNSNSEANNGNSTNENKLGSTVSLKDDAIAITNKFRQYLMYGSVKEALEWAMKNGLWGHALFLASKLDKRTYANVMKRFANGLPINDPLQTLYQLLSGSIPAAVTCVAEERWGDWRPHLAMILANSTSNADLERRSILHLGDTLDARGSIYAAQFCYLMAQVEFNGGKLNGLVGNGDNDGNNRLVLLGGDRRELEGNIRRYAKTEAIHMTEVYEYACGLNGDGFCIPAFQTYKYILATRLCDHGLAERSLAYLERIATIILASNQSSPSITDSSHNTSSLTGTSGNSTIFHPVLVNKVCQLADRLRYCDPSDELQQEDGSEESNGWLERLMKLDRDYSMGLISHSTIQNQEADNAANTEELTYDQKIWQQPLQQEATLQQQQQWQNHDQNPQQQQFDQSTQQFSLDQTLTTEGQSDYNQQQAFWPNQSQQLSSSYNSPVSSDLQDQLRSPDSQQWNRTQTEDVPQQRQLISMPNQLSRKAYDDLDDETSGPISLQPSPTKAKSQHTAKPAPKNDNKGWLGGIFGRFSMRPKNQMKLPDDKNPTIVWDPVKKRWMNTEEDGGDTASELRPPPKMADLMPQQKIQPSSLPSMSFAAVPAPTMAMPQQNGASNVAAMPAQTPAAQLPMVDAATAVTGKPPIQGGNMFKMQRGRNLKKSYVDVFNPTGTSSSGGGSAPALMADNNSIVPSATSGVPNFFIPPPVADPNAPTDFLTPTTGLPSIVDHQQQPRSKSRCSSPASSLSHEVTHYMPTAMPPYRHLTPTLMSPGSYHAHR